MSNFVSTDRALYHSSFLDACEGRLDVEIWSEAPLSEDFPESSRRARVFLTTPLIELQGIPNPLNRLRRFVDYGYETSGSETRTSFWQHRRRFEVHHRDRMMRALARLTPLALTRRLERWAARLVLRFGRSETALARFGRQAPAVFLAMCPFRPNQMSAVAAARHRSIPVVAFITSWDNLSTKTRLLLRYDRYLVWSESMRNELLASDPGIPAPSVEIVGVPMFDMFADPSCFRSRAWLCQRLGLEPEKPIIVYCLGSPNLIREEHGAVALLRSIAAPSEGLETCQVVVRPHPGFTGYRILDTISQFPRAVVQRSALRTEEKGAFQSREAILEGINTMRHADVVINLSSTVMMDAAIFDTPVINVDFDPEPGEPNRELVRDINARWTHLRPALASGGVTSVRSIDEMKDAIRAYLVDPSLHSEGRRRMVREVCGAVDGQAGARIAEALSGVAERS